MWLAAPGRPRTAHPRRMVSSPLPRQVRPRLVAYRWRSSTWRAGAMRRPTARVDTANDM